MTIAISLKVHDGIVLATDSATTIMGQLPSGQPHAIQVYNNANKLFNLWKGHSVGMITWGSGSIGTASISTLAKDLRRRFHGHDGSRPDWKMNPDSYSVKHIAEKTKTFYEDLYTQAFGSWPSKPTLGFIVAGYSSNGVLAEHYLIEFQSDGSQVFEEMHTRDTGLAWFGQPEAISRLVQGMSSALPHALMEDAGWTEDQVRDFIPKMTARTTIPFWLEAMPIKDAIDLAEFLVSLSINFSRFTPGAPTVGGPVEVACITKHEGFKWIRRKHYYSPKYNPEVRYGSQMEPVGKHKSR